MKICVFKIGKSPKFFCNVDVNDLQSRMMGDWELVELIRLLSNEHPNDQIYIIGRTRPAPDFKFEEQFPAGNVKYLRFEKDKEMTPYEAAQYFTTHPELDEVDEFHYLMGPHARYNGNMKLWDHDKDKPVKSMMCFENYVAPLHALMNKHPKASHFPYISDRRYVFIGRDLVTTPKIMLAQNVKPFELSNITFENGLETSKQGPQSPKKYTMIPFRFDTLVLYGKNRGEMADNMANWESRPYEISVVANQVSSTLEGSRYKEIKNCVLDQFSAEKVGIIGQWKHETMVNDHKEYFHKGRTDGWGTDYYEEMRKFKYSIIFFNWRDCSTKASRARIKDNWITPKVYETMLLGCGTFIHVDDLEMRKYFIPYLGDKLLFSTPEELKHKIDTFTKEDIINAQLEVLKPSYFDGSYFKSFIDNVRNKIYGGSC